MTNMSDETECPECLHSWDAHDDVGCNVNSCWCAQSRSTDDARPKTGDACRHPSWRFDDVGNHWCDECGLWHESPHLPADDPQDCTDA
jgi:hypothetical protein